MAIVVRDTVFGGYQSGGFSTEAAPTTVDHYGKRSKGPRNELDAVTDSLPVANGVTVDGAPGYLPAGRVFTQVDDNGTLAVVPGIIAASASALPVLFVNVSMDSNSAGTVMSVDGVPMTDRQPIPLWSLQAGYEFETSEYDSAEAEQLIVGAPLTATTVSFTAGTPLTVPFATAGLWKVGAFGTDTIIGIVVEGPHASERDNGVNVITVRSVFVPAAA